MKLILGPHDALRLGDFLVQGLTSDARSFRGASAFARRSGVAHLLPGIRTFSADRHFQLTVGIDLQGTSVEALEMLLDVVSPTAEIFVFHNAGGSTFHPKLFRFDHDGRTEVYVGSGNITQGGLFTNYEAGAAFAFRHDNPEDEQSRIKLEQSLDRWSDVSTATVLQLTHKLITSLSDQGLIVPEAKMPVRHSPGATTTTSEALALFGREAVQPAPPLSVGSGSTQAPVVAAPLSNIVNFVMTLERADAAKTPGRSPEFFIPVRARDMRPDFWGWPDQFVTQGVARNRYGVPFRFLNKMEPSTIFGYADRAEFRLRNSTMRAFADIGDILHVRHDETDPNAVYDTEIVRKGTPDHAALLSRCNMKATASARRYGYF